MSDGSRSITSKEDLHQALEELLREAHQNGVEVKGGWDFVNGDGAPDWDLVVTEVELSDD